MPNRSGALHSAPWLAGRALLLCSVALLAIGVVMVASAASSVGQLGAWYARAEVRHIFFAAAAVGALLLTARMDYRRLAWPGWGMPVIPAAFVVLGLIGAVLVFVPGIGHSVGGYHRWIRLGPRQYSIGFQPSELIKFSLPIFLAAWLSRRHVDVKSFRRAFLPAAILIGVCVGAVITQDFGTAAIIGVSAAVTLVLAGVPWLHLLSLLPPAAGVAYALVLRNPTRLARLTGMIDVWSSSNPSAYQPRQSLLAILTGGWFGKGVGRGTIKLGYLPEDSTDFIFAVICEEWGYIGAVVLLGLWLVWISRAWRSAAGAPNRFGLLLAGSLGFLVALQAILHVAVDMVLLPPTGMGLPFVSAGGTSLILVAAATGLIVSVTARSNRPGRIVTP